MAGLESLKIGIGLLDEQHYEILECFDTLLPLSDETAIKEAFTRLNDRTRQHFKYEQELQKSCNYPEYNMHKYHHNNYLYTFNALQKEFFEHTRSLKSLREQTRRMLQWFVDHIGNHDASFAKYYIQHMEQSNILSNLY